MGAEAWESRRNGYLGAFSGARYADRGLGFSQEAAPSWDADALLLEDKVGQGLARTPENKTKKETR